MVNKRFGLGILVMALVFGMAVLGCDDDATDNVVVAGSSLTTYAGDWINDADPDIEIEISSYAGGQNWSLSVDHLGVFAQDITLTGDIISLNKTPEDKFKVALGSDGKLTVSEGAGKFATDLNGRYTKKVE